jgi:sec-independent protein translocase protein TatB
MDFLGVGPLELVFILVIALIVLGPHDIARFARRAGRWLNRLYTSEVWGTLNRASREFRDLPNRLAREAALDDLDETLRQSTDPDANAGEEEETANAALEAWVPSPKTPSHTEAEQDTSGGEHSPEEASTQEGEGEAG